MRVPPADERARITESAVRRLVALAGRLQGRGHAPEHVARLIDRLLVCLFAVDAGVLASERLQRVLADAAPPRALFAALAEQVDLGGLLADEVVPLLADDLQHLRDAAQLDWSAVEPAILGTLFERGLDPARRSQLGAHYTDTAAIARIVEPVVLAPLRRELAATQETRSPAAFHAFLKRLRAVRVLDPSCGAGNFLYVALRALKDLEHEALGWARQVLAIDEPPEIGAQAIAGIELNPRAAELARIVVWIGEVQWRNAHGDRTVPALPRTIVCGDAILAGTDAEPRRPTWPDAEFIVGNPPFLGGKKLRGELGEAYVERLFRAWHGRVPREADLVGYWHEAAREQIAAGRSKRAGLLATQAIRGGANLEVLRRIKASGDIFMAWSDQPWVIEGASVRVSMVAQDDGSERRRELDGVPVAVIHADLTGGVTHTSDLTRARRLAENLGVAFMGDTKGGKFEVGREQAAAWLREASPRPNDEVVVPWVNGRDVTGRARGMHIIDFGVDMPESTAAQYPGPFAHVRDVVRPGRVDNRRAAYRERWWIHVEPRRRLRAAIEPLRRFIVTPTVAKHRIFVWLTRPTLPDHQLIVIARDDDYCFGVLHSRMHELWSLRMCTWVGAGNDPRYTPTTTFETFPFPWPLGATWSAGDARSHDAIAMAAAALHSARQRWLYPPELAQTGEPLAPGAPPPWIARDAAAARELRRRTLTALYNARPGWLVAAHVALDAAVAAAYGWPADLDDAAVLDRLLALNHARAGGSG